MGGEATVNIGAVCSNPQQKPSGEGRCWNKQLPLNLALTTEYLKKNVF